MVRIGARYEYTPCLKKRKRPINLFDSQLILTLLYDSLNLVINTFSSGLLGGMVRINEVKSAAEVGLFCTHSAPVHCLLGFLLILQGYAEALDR